MIFKKVKINCLYDFPEDINRIMEVGRANGILLEDFEAYLIWHMYSESMLATWIILPEDDKELWKIIESYTYE